MNGRSLDTVFALGLAALAGCLACAGPGSDGGTFTLAPDPGSCGARVLGRVVLVGDAPEPGRWDLEEDMRAVSGESEYVDERWLVGPEGGLANCVISLHARGDGPRPVTEPVPDAAFEKVGPRYRPRVLLVTPGTEVTLRNVDSPCNGFALAARKNRGVSHQITAGSEVPWHADGAEFVPVRCYVRTYMNGAIAVVDTPYRGLTDGAGRFEIGAVPPGRYRLRAWHEGLGSWTRLEVEVPDGGAVHLDVPAEAPLAPDRQEASGQ